MPANAARFTYTYVGQPYTIFSPTQKNCYKPAMHLGFTVVLDQRLPRNAQTLAPVKRWTVSDGRARSFHGKGGAFEAFTDAKGVIVKWLWRISIGDPVTYFAVTDTLGGENSPVEDLVLNNMCKVESMASNLSDPGAWTGP
jgi:hypothetical protein